MGRLRRAVLWLGLALWVILPVAMFLVVFHQAGRARIMEPAQTWAPVEPASNEVARNVGVLMSWDTQEIVVAPLWTGIVQRVTATPGEPLVSGDTVATVEGIERLAIHTTVPFSRLLSLGDTGEDVGQLNELLADSGLPHSDGDSYTPGTAAGVEDFAASIGVPTAERTGFDPSWVVYLPAESTVLESVELVVGAPAPAAGTHIGKLRAQLVSAEISTAETAETVERAAAPEGQANVDSGGTQPVAGESVEAAPDERLHVGSAELTVGDPRNTVAVEALETLEAQVVPGSLGTTARLVQPAGQDEFVVPAAAIFAGSGGRLCVLASTGGDEGGVAVPVSTVGSEDGRTVVTGGLSKDQRVLLSVPGERRLCE